MVCPETRVPPPSSPTELVLVLVANRLNRITLLTSIGFTLKSHSPADALLFFFEQESCFETLNMTA